MTTPPTNDLQDPAFDARLGADRDRARAFDDAALGAMWRAVAEETVERRPRLRDRVRELSTATRWAIGLGWMVALGALYLALGGLRGDLAGSSAVGVGLAASAFLAASVGALGLGLRPAWRPAAPGWPVGALLVVVPIVAALAPIPWPGFSGEVAWHVHLHCGGGASALAVGLALGLGLLDRDEPGALGRVVLRGGLAGTVAFGLGIWNCEGVHPLHLLLGHAMHGAFAAAVGLAVWAVLRVIPRA